MRRGLLELRAETPALASVVVAGGRRRRWLGDETRHRTGELRGWPGALLSTTPVIANPPKDEHIDQVDDSQAEQEHTNSTDQPVVGPGEAEVRLDLIEGQGVAKVE